MNSQDVVLCLERRFKAPTAAQYLSPFGRSTSDICRKRYAGSSAYAEVGVVSEQSPQCGGQQSWVQRLECLVLQEKAAPEPEVLIDVRRDERHISAL